MKKCVAIALIIIMVLSITACGEGSAGLGGGIPKEFVGTWYLSAEVLEGLGAETIFQTVLESDDELTIYKDGTYQLEYEGCVIQGKVEYNDSREMLKLYADPNTIGDWHDYEEDFEYPYSLIKMDGEHLLWYTDPDHTYKYGELSKSKQQAEKLDHGVYPIWDGQYVMNYWEGLRDDELYYLGAINQVNSIPWYNSFIERYGDRFRIWWAWNMLGGYSLYIEDAAGDKEVYRFNIMALRAANTWRIYDVNDYYWHKGDYDGVASMDAPNSSPEALPNSNETPSEGVIGYAKVIIDELYIRSTPSTEGNKPKRFAEEGQVYEVFDTFSDGQFTWYKVGDEEWFADDSGEWVVFTPISSD